MPTKQAPQATPTNKTNPHTWSPVLPSWTEPDRSHGCLRCGTTVLNLAAGQARADDCVPPENMDRVLSVKNVKTFTGHDGTGFNATLYVDGKRVGTVLDSAYGGSYEYQIKGDTLDELQRWARVKTENLYWDQLDILVGALVEDALETKRLKRLCKKQTVVKLPSNAEGEYTVWKQPYTAGFAESLRARHPDLVEIVNERFLKGGK